MAGQLHAELVEHFCRWLRRQGCRAILHDPFRAGIREQPDAIGWRDGVSIAGEAKASRADFLADMRKPWRRDPAQGVGDWRLYVAPAGIIRVSELPEGWGLLELQGTRLLPAHGVPKGNCNWWGFPFAQSNKRAETQLLVSAIAMPEYAPRRGAQLRRGIQFDAWREFLSDESGEQGQSNG